MSPKSNIAHLGSEKSRELAGAPTCSLASFHTVTAFRESNVLWRSLLVLASAIRSFGERRLKTYTNSTGICIGYRVGIKFQRTSNKMSIGMTNSSLRDLNLPLPLLALFPLGLETLARPLAGDRVFPLFLAFFRVSMEYH
jgi:hypothetical protein